MCHRRYPWPVFLLSVALAGCSSTVSSRFGGTPQSKSIAVVGDRPLPATTGEPGGQVAADVAEPEPRRNPQTRISGRVVDDQGEPVPNVTVRLADGGSKGGKDIRATTDRSGAFTLNGLRPGSTYSLVAEGEDSKGLLSGRAQARTADTGVEIGLLAEGANNGGAARPSSRSTKARPISNRADLDNPSGVDGGPKVNREDLPATDEDASTIDPGPPPPASSGRPQLSAPQASAGWRTGNATKTARSPTQDGDVVASSSDAPTRPRRAAPANPPGPGGDDEGPNPLPPAIDADPASDVPGPPRSTTARRKIKASPRTPDPGDISLIPEAGRDEKSEPGKRMANGPPDIPVAAGEGPTSALLPDPEPTNGSSPPTVAAALPAMPAIGNEPASPMEAPPPRPSTSVVQDVAPTNPASRPVFASDPPPQKSTAAPVDYNPFALVAANPPVAEDAATATPSMPSPDPSTSPPSPGRSGPTPPVAEGPRKKWGDLDPASKDRPTVVVEPTKASEPSSLVRRLRGSIEGRDPSATLCSYDPRQQRLKDFRLPDLEGKPVHFHDLDADYVLLDFWGTWCGPCLDSIPHLVALQKKYGPGRLRVVGIACEEVPPDQRKAKVEEVSRKLGINYAVLLSSMDGKPCPVQQALQIQAMPTMILVDRRGQVVWRNTGSTPQTLDRLDRVLASSMTRGETVRR